MHGINAADIYWALAIVASLGIGAIIGASYIIVKTYKFFKNQILRIKS